MKSTLSALLDYAHASLNLYMPVEIEICGIEGDDYMTLLVDTACRVTPYDGARNRMTESYMTEKQDGHWFLISDYHTSSPVAEPVDDFNRCFYIKKT